MLPFSHFLSLLLHVAAKNITHWTILSDKSLLFIIAQWPFLFNVFVILYLTVTVIL